MGYVDQHKEALLRRAGEEERGLFHMFIWLLNASFTSQFLFCLFGGWLPSSSVFGLQKGVSAEIFAGC